MPLSRGSKIKEVWRHPVGHALLQVMLRQQGRSERWLENPLVANAPLQRLDRLVGAGFSDMVLEMAGNVPEGQPSEAAARPVWWKEAVIYQIYTPSFMDSDHDGVGDLTGIMQRLPYLSSLGVDVLWLWPVLEQGTQGGVRSWEGPSEEFGTPEEFRELVEQAHSRGMKVVMGLDIAATSEEHPWFAGETPQEGYYILRPGTADAPPNNWTRSSQRSAWTWHPQFSAWGLHLSGRHKLDLNWENPALRKEMFAMLHRWADTGVDGFGFAPLHLLSKSGFEDGSTAAAGVLGMLGYEKYAFGPRLHRYLRELRDSLPELVLVGEVRGAGTEMSKLFTAEDRAELDMVVDAGHLASRGRWLRGEEGRLELAELKRYFVRWQQHYSEQRWMTLLLESYYTPRIVSRLGASPLYRAILAKLLAAMQLTLRGTPVLYQGQELGIPNTRFCSPEELRDPVSLRRYGEMQEILGDAPALQKVVCYAADHARTPMPWSSGPTAGFTGATPWMRLPDGAEYLNAACQMEDPHSVWQFYRRMLALRKSSQCLVYGSFNPVFVKNKNVFCYFRILENEKWYVELNLTEKEVARPGRILPSQKLEISNYDTQGKSLRPYEANVYRCE